MSLSFSYFNSLNFPSQQIMQTAKCPVCASDVIAGDEIYEGDIETCANCNTDLEIITLHPLSFKEIEEDDDDADLPDNDE